MRMACDTGGTFTDLVVEGDDGSIRMFKAPTTPGDPVSGVIDALGLAAADAGETLASFLGRGEMFIHGTTHAINAIITGNTAKTAFLTTLGHPDILVIREGGRAEPFDNFANYPDPYIPRALTFEIPGRILSTGEIDTPLDEAAVVAACDAMKSAGVEAVGVSLLWSIVNAAHEIRVAEIIEREMPSVPYTLSHGLNPSLREFRRASSTCIDASLKPLMVRYMSTLSERLASAGFTGRVLVLTSQGGVLDAKELAETPIRALNSGPSTAPLAGRYYSNLDTDLKTAIVADTGGTTYDVSIVHKNAIPTTREMWIGEPHKGHMTGFPSIDVQSVGAGGGSIASVDAGGLLHVGPRSAGAVPGPACYGRGNDKPTFSDACVVLGYVDPDFFLGGKMVLDASLAREAMQREVAAPLGLSVEEAAASVVLVATENMVQAIEDITVNQGIDPSKATLIGGGGAAGLNSVFIAKRLGCSTLLIPDTGPTLSAAGALMSDLSGDYQATQYTSTEHFSFEKVNEKLDGLVAQCNAFIAGPGSASVKSAIEMFAEARYEGQVWEIEIPLPSQTIEDQSMLDDLVQAFHAKHEEVFAYSDPSSHVEFVTWIARVRCTLRDGSLGTLAAPANAIARPASRPCYFSGNGWVDTKIFTLVDMPVDETFEGPAVVESAFTTIIVDPQSSCRRTVAGSIIVNAGALADAQKEI